MVHILITNNKHIIHICIARDSVKWYPSCGSSLATVNTNIYNDFNDPINSIPFDNNNNIWEYLTEDQAKITYIFDTKTNKTTAYITRRYTETNFPIEFSCQWDGVFKSGIDLNFILYVQYFTVLYL